MIGMAEDLQPLEYATQPEGKAVLESRWPVGIYVVALIWSAVTMRFYTAATVVYGDENFAQFRTQVALLICAVLRIVWARRRREQGRGWIFYVVILFLSPVIWAIASAPIAKLGHIVWGRPLMP